MAGLTLWLDSTRWPEHLRTIAESTPGLVPVVKGNGYGYGLARLAGHAADLGADTIAVGIPREVPIVRETFTGDVVILNPWESSTGLPDDPGVILTVSRLADLRALDPAGPRPRAVLELRTSMLRHGIGTDELSEVAELLDRIDFQGWTIHLPLLGAGRYAEAERLGRAALAVAPGPLWLSHLPTEEATALARQLAGPEGEPVPLRLRVGTRLWLGDEASRRTTATVLDVHPITRGDRAGYRQRRSPASGYIVVVAGGTSHGIGLEAPTSASSLRQRAVALAGGSLEAAGLALSPYTINGRKRWFYEPPHMQSSLVFLPAKEQPPAIGDEVPVELRATTATVDRIVLD